MFNADAQHQCTAATILSYLAGRIGETFHKRYNTGACERTIFYWTSFRSDATEVVPYSSSSLHQLHLLLISFHDSAIRIRVAIISNNEAIGKTANLQIISNACHWTALRQNIFEVFENLKYCFF